MGLLPDVRTYFEVTLLDALPANARVAALQHTDLFDMARAAEAVVLENRAEAESSHLQATSSVNALSLLDSDCDGVVPPPMAPTVAAVARPRHPQKKSDSLCANHARYGKETYKCQSPSTCRMRGVIKPRPETSASGNGPAGGPK